MLLRLLPKEYKYKINHVKILAKSDFLEEQAYFEVNIFDKEKADEICDNLWKNEWIRLPAGQKCKKKTGLHQQQFCHL